VFQDYLDAAVAGDGSTNAVISWFQVGGNTYIVEDNSASSTFQNGGDTVVKLVGLVDLSTADFAAVATTSATLTLA
jgi:S-layer protein